MKLIQGVILFLVVILFNYSGSVYGQEKEMNPVTKNASPEEPNLTMDAMD